MRLVRFSADDRVRIGAEHGDAIVDLGAAYRALCAGAVPGLETLPEGMCELLALGEVGFAAARTALTCTAALAPARARATGLLHPREAVRLLAPIADPRKIVGLGLNYRDHARECGLPEPAEPVLFAKYATALIGPDEPIRLPPASRAVDWEAELVLVIGRGGRDIPERSAEAHIAGVSCGNDITARDFQGPRGGGQWLAAKTFDTFAPLGPAIVTLDELPSWPRLPIRCRLGGETVQSSDTGELIVPPARIVAYVSSIVALEPGDLIFTGTPAGVGMARTPPRYLADGDVLEVEIDGVGTLRNPVRGA